MGMNKQLEVKGGNLELLLLLLLVRAAYARTKWLGVAVALWDSLDNKGS